MTCFANLHCIECTRSLHITGDTSYVLDNAALFREIHKAHPVVPLEVDFRWQGLDNGTNWKQDRIAWWHDRYEEYPAFIALQIEGFSTINSQTIL